MAYLLPPAGVKNFKNEGFLYNKVYSSDFLKLNSKGDIPSNIHDYRWTDYKEIERRCQEVNAKLLVAGHIKTYSKNVPRSQFNPAGPCPATVGDQFLVPPCPCPQHRGVGHRGGKDCACMADRPLQGRWGLDHDLMGNSSGVPQGGYQTAGYFPAAGQVDGMGNVGPHPQHGAHRPPAYCPPIGIDPRCLVRPRQITLDSSRRPSGAKYFAQESKSSCPEPQDAPILKLGTFTFDDWLQTEHLRQRPPSIQNACMAFYSNCCRSQNTNSYPTAYTIVPYQTRYCC